MGIPGHKSKEKCSQALPQSLFNLFSFEQVIFPAYELPDFLLCFGTMPRNEIPYKVFLEGELTPKS